MSRYGTDGKSGACRNFRDVKARNLTAKATLSPTELTEAHRINYMTSLCDILPFATDPADAGNGMNPEDLRDDSCYSSLASWYH